MRLLVQGLGQSPLPALWALFHTSSINALIGTPGPDGRISLREAILAADNTASGSPITITFAIPDAPVGGVYTIQPASALPAITDAVVIDGTSQSGYSGMPIIALNGSSAGANADGLDITGGGSTIRGLAIDNFSQYGISISANGDNTIAGDFIGTNAAGTTAGNGSDGILISSNNNLVGGTTAADRNIISGNAGDGIFVSGANNQIEDNYIGSNVTGTAALANGASGIEISGGTGNTVGGVVAGEGNVVSANGQYEVLLNNSSSSNLIEGNLIGTATDGISGVGQPLGRRVDQRFLGQHHRRHGRRRREHHRQYDCRQRNYDRRYQQSRRHRRKFDLWRQRSGHRPEQRRRDTKRSRGTRQRS